MLEEPQTALRHVPNVGINLPHTATAADGAFRAILRQVSENLLTLFRAGDDVFNAGENEQLSLARGNRGTLVANDPLSDNHDDLPFQSIGAPCAECVALYLETLALV